MNGKKGNKLPKTWSEERVRNVLAYSDRQTDDEVAREIDAAFEKPGHAIVAVPVELVSKVRKLVARQKRTKHAQRGTIRKTRRA